MVDENVFTGALPSSLSRLSFSLTYLKFSRSRLTGSLPSELSMLTNFEYITAHKNEFVGTLPESLSKWSKLEQVNFSDNNFSGAIPDSFSNWTSIDLMSLDNTQLYGSCGLEFCALVEKRRAALEAEGHIYRREDDGLLKLECQKMDCPCATVCCVNGEGCQHADPQ